MSKKGIKPGSHIQIIGEYTVDQFQNHCKVNALRTLRELLAKTQTLMGFVPLEGAKDAKVAYDPEKVETIVGSANVDLVNTLNELLFNVDGLTVRATTGSLDGYVTENTLVEVEVKNQDEKIQMPIKAIDTHEDYDHQVHQASIDNAPSTHEVWQENADKVCFLLGAKLDGNNRPCFGPDGEYIAQLPGGEQRRTEFNSAHFTEYGTSLVAVPTDDETPAQ